MLRIIDKIKSFFSKKEEKKEKTLPALVEEMIKENLSDEIILSNLLEMGLSKEEAKQLLEISKQKVKESKQ